MNSDGVPVTNSSEVQLSDQVITLAATPKAARPSRKKINSLAEELTLVNLRAR